MDESSRVPYLSAALLAVTALVVLQGAHAALLAPSDGTPGGVPTASPGGSDLPHDLPPGATLVSVQSYGGFVDNGRAVIVDRGGAVLWEFDPPGTRVFDAELLDDGNVLLALSERVPGADCPEEFVGGDHCVHNRVVEVTFGTKSVAWEYDWYDAFIHWHEVHDVDRLPSGETAIVDMGNNRAFTVDRSGEITWSWDADEHLGAGSPFREQYGGPSKDRPEDDWTHMNDIDRLSDGNFLLSIRNFDVTLEVDPETNEIVRVIGRPGATEVMHQQHNPQWLPERGTLLVADSENDRVVEVRPDGEVVWRFGGSGLLSWPRDADRLPNGNTVIADTYHNRVLEVTPEGEVVWSHTLTVREDGERKGGLVYSVDRLAVEGRPLAEEQSTFGDTNGTQGTVTPFPDGRVVDGGFLTKHLARVEAWASFYLPHWVALPELLTLAGGALLSLWLLGEVSLLAWRRW